MSKGKWYRLRKGRGTYSRVEGGKLRTYKAGAAVLRGNGQLRIPESLMDMFAEMRETSKTPRMPAAESETVPVVPEVKDEATAEVQEVQEPEETVQPEKTRNAPKPAPKVSGNKGKNAQRR